MTAPDMEKLRAIAIDMGRAALELWNDLPHEERRKTSLTDFQTDIVVRLCLEVAAAARAEANVCPHCDNAQKVSK